VRGVRWTGRRAVLGFLRTRLFAMFFRYHHATDAAGIVDALWRAWHTRDRQRHYANDPFWDGLTREDRQRHPIWIDQKQFYVETLVKCAAFMTALLLV
jgi:hypothetical protein